ERSADVSPHGRLVSGEGGNLADAGVEVEDRVGRRVAEARGEEARQTHRYDVVEGAAAPTRCRQDGVAVRERAAEVDDADGAGEARRPAGIDAVGAGALHLHQVEGSRGEGEAAGDRQRADRVAGRQRAAGQDAGRADRAVAGERGGRL